MIGFIFDSHLPIRSAARDGRRCNTPRPSVAERLLKPIANRSILAPPPLICWKHPKNDIPEVSLIIFAGCTIAATEKTPTHVTNVPGKAAAPAPGITHPG